MSFDSIPETNDPVQAVILDRLGMLHSSLEANRKETKIAFTDLERRLDTRMDVIETKVDKNSSRVEGFINRGRGGMIVLVGIGSFITWFFGLFDKIGTKLSGLFS